MADFILTFTGQHFVPLAPEADTIMIEDIAHALSMMTRANGHFPQFHSVAQHCLECAGEAITAGDGSRIALACLLHDGAEAYLADITRPVKHQLPEYIAAENRLLELIYNRFIGQVTPAERKRVKSIDDALLYYEFRHFTGYELSKEIPTMVSRPDFAVKDMKDVENAYLQLFQKLTGLVGRQQ